MPCHHHRLPQRHLRAAGVKDGHHEGGLVRPRALIVGPDHDRNVGGRPQLVATAGPRAEAEERVDVVLVVRVRVRVRVRIRVRVRVRVRA